MRSQEGTAREFSVWMLTSWSLSSDSLEKLYTAFFFAQNLHSGVLFFFVGWHVVWCGHDVAMQEDPICSVA